MAKLRAILYIRSLWGSQSWLQPAFSRLFSSRASSVSVAKAVSARDRAPLVETRFATHISLPH
jgi:hypothetical protein